jgi:hypothetical protein
MSQHQTSLPPGNGRGTISWGNQENEQARVPGTASAGLFEVGRCRQDSKDVC